VLKKYETIKKLIINSDEVRTIICTNMIENFIATNIFRIPFLLY
jgi:hypothetical protein